MKITIKKANELCDILGVTDKTITNRAKKIRIKEFHLRKKVLSGNMTEDKKDEIIIDMCDSLLGGYKYKIEDTKEQLQYTFYKYDE